MKSQQNYKIPVSEPNLTEQDFLEIKKVFNSSWISSKSPWVDKFEKEFARKVSKTKYAISVNSGTSALFLALKSLGVGEGDEVILPNFTMIATVNAVVWAGAKPVLIDCESFDNFNFSMDDLKRAITPKTKVIMPVHVYGYSSEMDKLMKIAKEKNIYVIEDAAEAMGSTYKGKNLGSFGDLSCFSLYSNKIITTGNGGMVATNSKKLASIIRQIRFFDFNEKQHFKHNLLGYNLVLSGLQAALGVSQIRRFEKLLTKRIEIFGWYYKNLCKNKEIKFFLPDKKLKPNYWFPAIIFPNKKIKDRIINFLIKNKIETRVFFCPVSEQPLYRKMFNNKKFPKSKHFFERGLLLPSYYDLNKEEVNKISNLIIKALSAK